MKVHAGIRSREKGEHKDGALKGRRYKGNKD